MKQLIYHYLLEPRANAIDSRRREFILNILLVGLFAIGSVALLIVLFDLATSQVVYGYSSLLELIFFLLIISAFWRASRAGWYSVISYILLVSIGSLAVALILQWSFELPMAELAYGLMVVVSGVLLTARSALLFSGLAVACLALISWQQVNGRLHPRTDWLDQPPVLSDVIGYATIFGAMGLVSWLANREIDRSLQRARLSEAALAVERDSLELKVKQRTRQLETAQLTRTMELQRFAEFGRINAHLLHEIANPLTAASLNLEQYDGRQSRLVAQARRNLSQLERYLKAARQQLQNQSRITIFSVNQQLKQIERLAIPLAKRQQVKLSFKTAGSYKLQGDPVRFSQLVANLVVNAIEAYPKNLNKARRDVSVIVRQAGEWLEIAVRDYGGGITQDQLPHLFEPFYTTKLSRKRGIGIGLALVKQYVEVDFHGSVKVTSSPAMGTQFTVRLKSSHES